jgi:hypothetical protein
MVDYDGSGSCWTNFRAMAGNIMLRVILSILIDKYGMFRINDTLAEMFNDRIDYDSDDKEDYEQNKFNDELSEAYDNINKKFFCSVK